MTWISKGLQLLQDPDGFYTPSAVNNDYFQAEHHNIIIMANRGNHVISGLEVTEDTSPSLSILISGGSAYVNGIKYPSIAGTNIDLTSAVPGTGGNSRYVIVYVDSSGVIQTINGTITVTGGQSYPELPEDSTALAVVVLTNGDVTVDNADIGDMRIFVSNSLYTSGDFVASEQLISEIVTGTSPLVVASTTLVSNLNADLLDGQEGSYYAIASHNHDTWYQPLDANLTTISALSPIENNVMIAGAADWEQKTPAETRSILDLEIGTDVQAFNSDLSTIAGFVHVDGKIMVSNGAAWVLESGSVVRDSIGLGVTDVPQFAGTYLTGDLNANGLANISMTEMSYLDNATSNIQTQITANDVDIATNISDIADNVIDIGTNLSNINSNDIDIAANTAAIVSNDVDIAANAADIISNGGDIATNQGNITTNQGNITGNANDISDNTDAIDILEAGSITQMYNAIQLFANSPDEWFAGFGSLDTNLNYVDYRGVSYGNQGGSIVNLFFTLPIIDVHNLVSIEIHGSFVGVDIVLYSVNTSGVSSLIETFSNKSTSSGKVLLTLATPSAPADGIIYYIKHVHNSGTDVFIRFKLNFAVI